MLFKNVLIGLIILISLQATAQSADPAKMKTFIDVLMKKMTLEEKLGQLNLPAGAGDIVTGAAASTDIVKKIQAGKVGGLFNIKSAVKIKSIQKIAYHKNS